MKKYSNLPGKQTKVQLGAFSYPADEPRLAGRSLLSVGKDTREGGLSHILKNMFIISSKVADGMSYPVTLCFHL